LCFAGQLLTAASLKPTSLLLARDGSTCIPLTNLDFNPTTTSTIEELRRVHGLMQPEQKKKISRKLIAAGFLGMAQALGQSPLLARALALAGAIFLAVCGWRSLLRARHANQLISAKGGAVLGRGAVLAQAAAFTLLNPHVYLATVLLVGSIGAQQPAALRGWFIAGASSASLLWFALLGFGARWLAPWFARPRAWQVMDGLIALSMFVLSALLLRHVVSGT
jgi:L-lysine exporter family protein LysE/ArgO